VGQILGSRLTLICLRSRCAGRSGTYVVGLSGAAYDQERVSEHRIVDGNDADVWADVSIIGESSGRHRVSERGAEDGDLINLYMDNLRAVEDSLTCAYTHKDFRSG
jgi:hypothetical protein